jgi:hypothetical protein
MEIINHKALGAYALILVGAFVLLNVFKAIYNLYFHPLRKFPGPWLNKISIVCTIFQRST